MWDRVQYETFKLKYFSEFSHFTVYNVSPSKLDYSQAWLRKCRRQKLVCCNWLKKALNVEILSGKSESWKAGKLEKT